MRWSGLIFKSNRERATTIVSLLTGPSARRVGNRPETSVTIGDQVAMRQDKPQGHFRNDGFGRSRRTRFHVGEDGADSGLRLRVLLGGGPALRGGLRQSGDGPPVLPLGGVPRRRGGVG